jgi:hypothetical protein
VDCPLICLCDVLPAEVLVAWALGVPLVVLLLLAVLHLLLVVLQMVLLQVLVPLVAIQMVFLGMVVFLCWLVDLADWVLLLDTVLRRLDSWAFPYALCVG